MHQEIFLSCSFKRPLKYSPFELYLIVILSSTHHLPTTYIQPYNSGQSYKHFTIVNYDTRVIFLRLTTGPDKKLERQHHRKCTLRMQMDDDDLQVMTMTRHFL